MHALCRFGELSPDAEANPPDISQATRRPWGSCSFDTGFSLKGPINQRVDVLIGAFLEAFGAHLVPLRVVVSYPPHDLREGRQTGMDCFLKRLLLRTGIVWVCLFLSEGIQGGNGGDARRSAPHRHYDDVRNGPF